MKYKRVNFSFVHLKMEQTSGFYKAYICRNHMKTMFLVRVITKKVNGFLLFPRVIICEKMHKNFTGA